MDEPFSYTIRPYQPSDRAEVTAIAQRLVENGIPPWRDPVKALDWHNRATESIFEEGAPGDAVLVAQASSGGLLGFVALRTNQDFQTGEEQGYVSDFAVTQPAEGRGVAQALMAAAEEWALNRKFRFLTLDVFGMNPRARAFYARVGFAEQNLRLVKVLRQPERPSVESETNPTGAGYTCVAAEYARHYFHELDHKPFDRQQLERLAAETKGKGPVCDVGCGPGEVARYLKDQGADVLGIDLSLGMVAEAARLSPDIPFYQGNMLTLDVPDGSWAGIAAFYSLIHIPRPQIVSALRELGRVLQPGGVLLLSFHIGSETVHTAEWWGQAVSLDFNFYQPGEMEDWLAQAGFGRVETLLREPYPEVEHQSRRAYLWGYWA